MTQTLPPRSAQADRLVRNNTPMHEARTCYDHLAGVLGIRLIDGLVSRGWVVAEPSAAGREDFRLTEGGREALSERGVDIAAAEATRRRFASGCLDWTERRPHLAGSLGAAILAALVEAGVVSRTPGDRTVAVTGSLDDWLTG